MAGDPSELLPDLRGRQHEIDRPGCDGAPRHALLLGRVVLSERDAAARLDLLDAERSVVRGAGEDDADALVPMLFGERAHEMVDRPLLSPDLGSWGELQMAVAEDEVLAWGNDVNVIRLHRHVVR